jgi:hypothetical protein
MNATFKKNQLKFEVDKKESTTIVRCLNCETLVDYMAEVDIGDTEYWFLRNEDIYKMLIDGLSESDSAVKIDYVLSKDKITLKLEVKSYVLSNKIEIALMPEKEITETQILHNKFHIMSEHIKTKTDHFHKLSEDYKELCLKLEKENVELRAKVKSYENIVDKCNEQLLWITSVPVVAAHLRCFELIDSTTLCGSNTCGTMYIFMDVINISDGRSFLFNYNSLIGSISNIPHIDIYKPEKVIVHGKYSQSPNNPTETQLISFSNTVRDFGRGTRVVELIGLRRLKWWTLADSVRELRLINCSELSNLRALLNTHIEDLYITKDIDISGLNSAHKFRVHYI